MKNRIRRLGLVAVAVPLLLVSACSFQPVQLGGMVGQPGPRPGAATTPQAAPDARVRYSVLCQECIVSYTRAGGAMEQRAVKGSWTTTVAFDGRRTPYVVLTAAPSKPGTFVRRATIEIDGAQVAEEKRNGSVGLQDEIQLSAQLPSTPVQPRGKKRIG